MLCRCEIEAGSMWSGIVCGKHCDFENSVQQKGMANCRLTTYTLKKPRLSDTFDADSLGVEFLNT